MKKFHNLRASTNYCNLFYSSDNMCTVITDCSSALINLYIDYISYNINQSTSGKIFTSCHMIDSDQSAELLESSMNIHVICISWCIFLCDFLFIGDFVSLLQ